MNERRLTRSTFGRGAIAAAAASAVWASLALELPGRLAASGSPSPSAIQKKILANGLTLISERDASSGATVLQILIKGGKRAEPAGRGGLAFLATRLAVEIPDDDKARELIGLASRFEVVVKGDYSVIQVECLSSVLEATLQILAKIVRAPLLSGFRIDLTKKNAEAQGRREEDDSIVLGHLAALEALSANLGYGGSVFGSRATLGAVKGRDIADFCRRRFVGPNMIVAISSERDDAPALVEKAFGDFLASPAPGADESAPSAPERREVHLSRETRQAFVSLAFPLPKLSRRTCALDLLLENLLGKGPGSRLWPLREEKRLAYTVNAVATPMMGGGLLEAYLETDKAKTAQALDALRSVLNDLFRNGLSEADLADARTAAWADFLRQNEMREARTLSLASFEAMGLGVEFYGALEGEMASITLDEANSYARQVFDPERAVAIVIGPGRIEAGSQSSD